MQCLKSLEGTRDRDHPVAVSDLLLQTCGHHAGAIQPIEEPFNAVALVIALRTPIIPNVFLTLAGSVRRANVGDDPGAQVRMAVAATLSTAASVSRSPVRS